MAAELFDEDLRALRRDRAFRRGPVLFVYERAFSDISERLAEVSRRFTSALAIGAPDPSWPEKLQQFADGVQAIDPGAEFARAASGRHASEGSLDFSPGSFDLCVAIGTLDTIDDLPGTLRRIGSWLKPDSLLLGVIAGGDTLPQLRAAMRAADIAAGAASPHVHPRVEASALGHLLSAAGFVMPVVDVDRVRIAYSSLPQLVTDLRGMGVTNVLRSRSRCISPAGLAAAEAHFRSAGHEGRTVETFELLHFAAWTRDYG
ncbi:MAG: methyltransferase domain-containing protein [Sphingomonas sp.]|nr:methyltransferase domain-containing protein [Sphingomonas sp.]